MRYKEFVRVENLLEALRSFRETRDSLMDQKKKQEIFKNIMKNFKNETQ